MEEASWRRHHGGGIMEEAYMAKSDGVLVQNRGGSRAGGGKSDGVLVILRPMWPKVMECWSKTERRTG